MLECFHKKLSVLFLTMNFFLKCMNSVEKEDQATPSVNQIFRLMGPETRKVEDIRKMPYSVPIFGSDKKYICAGTLISNRHVLTAAHCTKKCLTKACGQMLQPHEITVGVGFLYLDKNKNKMAAELEVKSITAHPKFDCCRKPNEKSGHDIAVIELEADVPAEMSRRMVTKAAKVAPLGSLQGLGIKVLSVAGWGQSKTGSYSEQLSDGTVDLVAISTCKNQWSSRGTNLPQDTLCVNANKASICQGDSGGPLIYTDRFAVGMVIGVASFAAPCDQMTKDRPPAIYTNVAIYEKWITSMIH